MGLFRTLLAIAVICFHTESLFGVILPNGVIAVQCFYMVSGFYMALILSGAYNGRVKEFYMARALRIFPIYWIVLALSIFLGWSGSFGPLLVEISHLSIISQIMIYFANITMVGLDWFQFFAVNDAGLPILSSDFVGGDRYVRYIAVNQMWTIGIEITFYVMAPFLLRLSSYKLILICITSIVARHFAYQQGLSYDPWNYRFFPFELVFFLFGALAYRSYQRFILPYYGQGAFLYGKLLPYVSWCALLCLLLATFVLQYLYAITPSIKHYGNLAQYIYFSCTLIALPFVFACTRNSKLDHTIGQLSYPLYVVHFVFILYFSELMKSGILPYGVSVVLASTLAAIALVIVTKPIENFRGRYRNKVDKEGANE